jgi:hypothetical protein
MECPHCGRKIDALDEDKCPECGRPLDATVVGVVKTSQVRVAAGDEDRIYHSMDELPPDLRRQLRQVLNGPLSDTIVIADEAGRKRIFEAIRGLPPHLQKKVLAAIQVAEPVRRPLSRWMKAVVLALLLLALAALVARLWVWG